MDFSLARKSLIKSDKKLGDWIQKVDDDGFAVRFKISSTPYVYLCRAIVAQQISVAAARTIWGRFEGLFVDGSIDFKKLARMKPETLRKAGLSRQKIIYLKDIAMRVNAGLVPDPKEFKKMTDEQIIETLLPIKGVGVWTIQMLLIFLFRRPDVWPVKDLGVRKGFMKVHGMRAMPEEKYLMKYGERFRPYRSAAALYYWKALEKPNA